MTDPTGELSPQPGSPFSREAHMHTTAHALRRAAQLLRLLADQLDPQTVMSFTTKNGGGFSELTITDVRVIDADCISNEPTQNSAKPGSGRIARY